MTDTVASCLAGALSAPVAIAHLLLGGMDAAAISAAVASARPDPPTVAWQELSSLLMGREAALNRLADAVRASGSDHTALGDPAAIAAFFDRAVAVSPEAGVALFSLGDPTILHAATAEIVDWLDASSLLSPESAVLDLGCGIGRIAAALSSRCGAVLGLDISAGMVAEARRRHAALGNVEFVVGNGTDVPPGPFDLVLLVDSMPYMVAAGLADEIVGRCAAALRPGGALVILNLSYGRTADADEAHASRWAAAHGWSLAADRPFGIWDGKAFVLRSRGLAPG